MSLSLSVLLTLFTSTQSCMFSTWNSLLTGLVIIDLVLGTLTITPQIQSSVPSTGSSTTPIFYADLDSFSSWIRTISLIFMYNWMIEIWGFYLSKTGINSLTHKSSKIFYK